jgi:hypothetical protein
MARTRAVPATAQTAPPATITWYGAGEAATRFLPGDFILTHGDGVLSHLIRFGQRIRFRGDDRRYAYWNHAALIVSTDGAIIEALAGGVTRRHLDVYTPREYHVVQIEADPLDRRETVAFAEWAATNRSRYGYATFVSIAICLLTGARLTFFVDGEYICSGLVARALERTEALFGLDPVHVTPADLARYYQVLAPPAILPPRQRRSNRAEGATP